MGRHRRKRLQALYIADITDDKGGSVPCNLGDTSILDPVYGVDKQSRQKTAPYQPNSIDIMAVGNLPNELPRDASRYFGEQLIKHVLEDLVKGGSPVIDRATMVPQRRIDRTVPLSGELCSPIITSNNNPSSTPQTPPYTPPSHPVCSTPSQEQNSPCYGKNATPPGTAHAGASAHTITSPQIKSPANSQRLKMRNPVIRQQDPKCPLSR